MDNPVPEDATSSGTGTEVFAGFALTGSDFDPNEVTRRVGLEPTKTWKTGDLRVLGSTIRHRVSGWSLRTTREQTSDTNSHITQIIDLVRPHISIINEVRADLGLEAELFVVLYIRGERPGLSFDRTVLDAVDELNAEIDVDIYVLPHHN